MKKTFLFAFLNLIFFNTNAQIEKFLSNKNDNLSSWVISKSREEKKKIIDNSIKKDKPFEQAELYCKSGKKRDFYNFFNFADFNNDGLEDIIYSGYSDGEGDLVIIYQNQGNANFEKIFQTIGGFCGTSLKKQNEKFQFQVYDAPCCGGNHNTINHFVLAEFGGKMNVQLTYQETYFDGTIFPKEFLEKNIPFVVKNDNYKLRNTPNINDEIIDWTSYNASESNVLAEYPKGSRGVALAEQIDETGRKWFFVKMFNNLKPNKTMFSLEDNNIMNCNHYGWMSSNFLEILE